ncbi:MAG: sulfatase [Kiritimatiellales bacterium]
MGPKYTFGYGLAASCMMGSVALNSLAAENRPNILFAFADDWGFLASAYAGHIDGKPGELQKLVSTPNFDRVADNGVLFTHAYVSAPSCTPCRSALLTGQHFFRTGSASVLLGVWDPALPSFPLLLRDQAGYHIGQTYKVWAPGRPEDAPYGGKQHEYERRGTYYNQFSQRVTYLVEKEGKSVEKAKQSLYEEALGNFEDFLADRKSGQPFCYWWGPLNTHRSWKQGSGKKLWGINPDDLKGNMPGFLPDVPLVREDLADYMGEASAFDAGLGVLLKKIEEMGELDNTLVIVSGDHGPPGFPRGKTNLYDFGTQVSLAIMPPKDWGRRARVVNDFITLPDLAPTFLETAGLAIPNVMTGRSLVELIRSGKSGWVDPSRDYVITGRENHAIVRPNGVPYPQRALRVKDWLYIYNFKPDRWPEGDPVKLTEGKEPSYETLRDNSGATLGDIDAGPTKAYLIENRNNKEVNGAYYFDLACGKRPQEELFHIPDDPWTMHNVADQPENQTIRKELHDRLMKLLYENADPRVLDGDHCIYEQPDYRKVMWK